MAPYNDVSPAHDGERPSAGYSRLHGEDLHARRVFRFSPPHVHFNFMGTDFKFE